MLPSPKDSAQPVITVLASAFASLQLRRDGQHLVRCPNAVPGSFCTALAVLSVGVSVSVEYYRKAAVLLGVILHRSYLATSVGLCVQKHNKVK